jgi:Domain of unknown function (DUF1989)
MQEVGGSIPPGSTRPDRAIDCLRRLSPSSRGLGHHPFTVRTGVRIPVGTPHPAGSRAGVARMQSSRDPHKLSTAMDMAMPEKFIVPAGGGAGLRLKHGESLRVIDIEGGQTGDLVAFSADGKHRLCSARTFDYGGKIYVSTGDVLWSDRSNPMLTIVADDVGKHDLLYAPCSIEMYRIQYGITEYQRRGGWSPVVPAAEDAGGCFYHPACGDGSLDRSLFVPCIYMQRRRANHAFGL